MSRQALQVRLTGANRSAAAGPAGAKDNSHGVSRREPGAYDQPRDGAKEALFLSPRPGAPGTVGTPTAYAVGYRLTPFGLKGAEHNGAERKGAERKSAERKSAERKGAERKGAERKGAENSGTERTASAQIRRNPGTS
jgi:hypothetical protein